MTLGLSDIKFSENGQGDVLSHGIAEYTSRPCRQELASEVYRTIHYQVQIEKNECRRTGKRVDRSLTACNVMADSLEVTRRTVRRWRNGGFQSCNFNANKLISLSLKYAPEKTLRILEKDLDRHWQEYFKAVAKNGQGDVLSQSKRWL